MNIKKGPESGDTLSKANNRPSQVDKSSTDKLAKYARLKSWNCQIGAILGREKQDTKLEQKLLSCGRFLSFNRYLFSGELKLTSGNYCNLHMLCPCCAAARSRRLLARWLPVVFNPAHEKRVRHYLLTLTWPPPAAPRAEVAEPVSDLKANLSIGLTAWGKLWKRRKNRRTGPLQDVLGAILATEVTKGPAGWHPHFHILITMPRNKRISAADLRQEWHALTGGRQIRLDPLRTEADVVEVFKYAVKPADRGKEGLIDVAGVLIRHDIWTALSGSRLIRGYGGYFNVQDEDLTDPETVEDLGSWVELIFRWADSKYELVRETPHYEVDKETGVILGV